MVLLSRSVRFIPLLVCGLCMVSYPSNAFSNDDPSIDRLQAFLAEGKLEEGELVFEKWASETPDNPSLKASLGILQFMRSIEYLGQSYYRYGANSERRGMIGLLPLRLPSREHPDEISSADARIVLETFLKKLTRAEQTLSQCKPSNIKLVIDFAKIQMDLDDDANATANKSFVDIMSQLMGVPAGQRIGLGTAVFALDDADLVWLRGYTHVLMAITEVMLAYDWNDAFDRVGHLFFPRVKSPYTFLRDEKATDFQWRSNEVLDFIAFIHVMNFEVREADRMQAALVHMEQVVSLSRETWRLVRLENDDDREWLPGPKQHSLILGNRVGGPLGSDWEQVLNRVELVLQGKELLPFWRGIDDSQPIWIFGTNQVRNMKFNPKLGINFRKIFTEPKRFDLVLWLQGTGVSPFLEEGPIGDPAAWQSLSGTFQGRLPFFSFWIN